MKLQLKLFQVDTKASDNSVIPSSVVMEYLSSKDYKNRIKNNLFLGGLTHVNRNDPEVETSLGEFDQMLITGNITHYITNLSISSDNWVYAEAVVMDDEKFYTGESKGNILILKRLLHYGVMPPISVVVKAYWDAEDRATKIVMIGGMDFTLSPGYGGAGVTEIIYENEK